MRRADIIRQEIEDLERLLQGNYPLCEHSGRAGSVGHGGFALFCNAIGPKTSTTFFFFLTDQMQT